MDVACKNNDPSKTSACQHVNDDGTVCGEPKIFGVEIFDEFNQIYENRLNYIDKEIGSDCSELKCPIYKDWVRDLIAQNKKFIQILDELEREANHRFELLETKLKSDTSAFGGDSRYKKLESDLKNLLELIHRALETNKWSVEGLEFQTITVEDIFGNFLKKTETESVSPPVPTESEAEKIIKELNLEMDRLKNELKHKNCIIEDYKGRIKNLQIDCNPCENYDSKSELEDKFKTYIEELKVIIKDKDAKNSLLNQENENLKLSLSKNVENSPEPEKKNEFETLAQETEPSAAQTNKCVIGSSDLDLDNVEHTDRIQSDISICNRLNQEIGELLTQIRARESHICNQNSIICNFQEKLNETRLQLKLITCERDQVCNKLSIIESELEKIKDDINQCPESAASNTDCIDTSSRSPCTDDDDPCKSESSDKKSVILHLKPMVNCMREKIVNLNHENCCLKCNLEEFKECLSRSQSEIVALKKKLSDLSNKSYADKEVLVKFKCKNKTPSADTENRDVVDDCCCSIEKMSKRKEACVQQFKSIFKEFLCKFGIDVDECDLDRLARGDKKCIDKLVGCIKQSLQKKNEFSVSESTTTDICKLKEVLLAKESEIFDLKSKLIKLNIEAENCSQTFTDDKVKILSEERDRLDLECKNQLTTIENLREALEMLKRGNNMTSVSQPNGQNVQQASSLWGWWRNVHDV